MTDDQSCFLRKSSTLIPKRLILARRVVRLSPSLAEAPVLPPIFPSVSSSARIIVSLSVCGMGETGISSLPGDWTERGLFWEV